MRVCFTAIAFDPDPEHKKLAAMLDSAKAAGFTDYVVAVDEKSVPDTADFIRSQVGGDVFSFKMERDDGIVDFAAARNLTLARIPKECQWWGWADTDDVIEKLGSQSVVEFLERERPDVQTVYFEYDYLKDEYGNHVSDHLKGRFYRIGSVGWEWKRRIHEDCFPTQGSYGVGPGDVHFRITHMGDADEGFRWVQDTTDRHQGTASARNLPAIRAMIEENPDDAAAWHTLGNQYYADQNYTKAALAYAQGAKLDDWIQRRWTNLIYESICYRNLGLFDKAIETDTSAIHLCPELADGYFGLAHSYVSLSDWDRAKRFGELGISRLAAGDGVPSSTVFFNSNHYSFSPYLTLATAYFNLGDWKASLSAYEQAYKARPEPGLKQRIDHLTWAIDRQRITHNGIDLAAGLMRRNEPLKALEVLSALPAGSADEPNVMRMRERVITEVAHLRDRTSYQNLYFLQEERNDPFDESATDESILRFMPRLTWALRRLQAAGVKRVLDVGIGDATPAFYFARHGIQVVGIDVDVRRVKDANWNAVKAGFQDKQIISFDPEGDEEVPAAIEVPLATRESMAQFLYCPPGEITAQVEALGPFDAVLCLELIEHVADTEALLEVCERMAPLVLLSTPDGSYDGPQLINHGHVRAWSQRDLTRLMVGRGKLIELHRINLGAGEQANLVCEYRPRESLDGVPVIIWCPNTDQDWTPDSLWRGGIGGSETAVIRVAEELAKTKRVTVFAECEGVWGGVRYAFVENFVPSPCEMFISWRTYGVLEQMKKYAQHRFIWAHDVHFGAAADLDGITVLALSEWHKSFLAETYPGANIVVSGNGIDPGRFDKMVKRIPHRIIYAQSPDRGLDVVLGLFPKIRATYPDATLEVFYGFDLCRKRDPGFVAKIEEMAQQPGVTLHGRVDQDRLAEEYLKADVLIYPAQMPNGEPFNETYCISVVEALAAGCLPITADHGALRETNWGGAHGRHGTFEADALRQLFAFWARPLKEQNRMRDHGHIGSQYNPDDCGGRQWARRQTWQRIADQWLSLIATDELETSLHAVGV